MYGLFAESRNQVSVSRSPLQVFTWVLAAEVPAAVVFWISLPAES